MDRVAEFEKVPYDEFRKSMYKYLVRKQESPVFDAIIQEAYDHIKLPVRSTSGAAGYDFYMPFDYTVRPRSHSFFPTGIRCRINEGYVLMLFPRSGLGSKFGMRLVNTVGVIDSDYYGADNYGHIGACFNADEEVTLKAGDRFMQGVLIPFGVTDSDSADGVRVGGHGSTGK